MRWGGFPHLVIAGLLVATVASTAAISQTGPLIVDQNRLDRRPEPTVAPPPPQASVSAPQVRQTADTVALRQVVIEGSKASPGLIMAAWKPFLGRALTAETIAGVANSVALAYARSTVGLYTIDAPQQDLSKGVLRLRVTEGYISNVVVYGDVRGSMALIKAYGNELTRLKPIRRSDLERYMSLIRDIPGITVDAQLAPGRQRGAAELRLKVTQKRWDWGYSINTRGSPLLGRTQIQGDIVANSALRQGDQTRVDVMTSNQPRRLQYASVSHSTPIGSDGLRLTGNVGTLRTRPKGLPLKGHADFAGIQVSYPLVRGYRRNVYLSGGFDALNSDNAVFGSTVSRSHTRALRGSLSADRSFVGNGPGDGGALSASATISHGIDALGARTDVLSGKPDYTKVNIRAGADKELGKPLVVRLRASAQLSGDRLPAVEQFAFGGDEFGRGFPQATALGDRGWAASAEVALRPQKGLPKAIAGSEFYIFGDVGRIWAKDHLPYARAVDARLSSAGLGARLNVAGKYVVSVEAGRPLQSPSQGVRKDWRFGISWRSLF